MHPQVHATADLFEGYGKAYGTYTIDPENIAAQGKLTGRASTLTEEVTDQVWDDHLMGRKSLGVIPINENSEVKFGAIDIDDYHIDLKEILIKIEKHKLPLVPCRSKSGGLHLFLFLIDFTPAGIVQDKLREFASFLGYGNSEIYPKQRKLLISRGDQGSWLNMPYFDAKGSLRYGYSKGGRALHIDEFIKLAFERRASKETVIAFEVKTEEALLGGPPCLQLLISQGFPEGTRNNGLFNIGVYCKKAHQDKWREKIQEYNQKYMDPPLTNIEVQGLIKSLDRKDYQYTCNAPPIQSFCNRSKCLTCRHGVGTGTGMPTLGTLTKICTNPPIWFIDVEGGSRLELTTEELQQPLRFQKRCMDVLNIMPQVMKRDNWTDIVSELLTNVNTIEVPDDATPEGQLWEHLADFLTGRAQARTFADIFTGKPLYNNREYYFRIRDFIGHLKRLRFDEFRMHKIINILKERGAQHEFINKDGKGANLWIIPEKLIGDKLPKLRLPDQDKEDEF